jgi:Flp pilus assembly protein CpaB
MTATRITPGRGGTVAARVPDGLRAFGLPSDVAAGAVRTGDRIDVFATFTSGAPHTELVAAGVQVLGEVSSPAQSGVTTKPSLEVLVSPDDASRLAYASTFAKISVALLGPSETPETATPEPSFSPQAGGL